jgi:hypothetical protein
MTSKLLLFTLLLLTQGCAIEFSLPTQRTSLENQILGSYRELDDDLVLVSSVRALDSSGQKKEINVSDLQQQALRAKQNQDFNRDDIDELKQLEIIGEKANGEITLLPKGVGRSNEADRDQVRLAEVLVAEENHDRNIVWLRIIQMNENLSQNDLPQVRETFAKQLYAQSPGNSWFQDAKGTWTKKPEQDVSPSNANPAPSAAPTPNTNPTPTAK